MVSIAEEFNAVVDKRLGVSLGQTKTVDLGAVVLAGLEAHALIVSQSLASLEKEIHELGEKLPEAGRGI